MVEIARNDAGKPVVKTPSQEGLSVSLTHDHRYCVGVAGEGEQGVDIESVTKRTEDEWRSLLGPRHPSILEKLASDDGLDRAGTRIWGALEALFKALGTHDVTLDVASKKGSAVVLVGRADDGRVRSVLTTPVVLTLGTERMIAVVVESAATIEPQPDEAPAKVPTEMPPEVPAEMPAEVPAEMPAHEPAEVPAEVPSEVPAPPTASVLAQPELSPEAMLAAMEKANSVLPGLQKLAAVGYDPSSYVMDGDEETRQFILRWPLSFREGANVDRSIYFTHWFDWMGKVRELAMQPIAAPFAQQMSSGTWGMVTNHSAVKVLGNADSGDTIEVRYWVRRAQERPESTVDLMFDWRRRRGDVLERIALGELRTTWVALIGHGQVRAEPLPDYFQAFVDARTPPDVASFVPQKLPEPLAGVDVGARVYQRPEGPARGPRLGARTYDTCLLDSNLVGNIYFSNYYAWQARLVDAHFQALVPGAFRGPSALGAPKCLRARVDHLVDAMPFDRIEVEMSLESLSQRGYTLGFDYFRAGDGGARTKLAYGEQDVVWMRPGAGAVPVPDAVRKALLARAAEK